MFNGDNPNPNFNVRPQGVGSRQQRMSDEALSAQTLRQLQLPAAPVAGAGAMIAAMPAAPVAGAGAMIAAVATRGTRVSSSSDDDAVFKLMALRQGHWT